MNAAGVDLGRATVLSVYQVSFSFGGTLSRAVGCWGVAAPEQRCHMYCFTGVISGIIQGIHYRGYTGQYFEFRL